MQSKRQLKKYLCNVLHNSARKTVGGNNIATLGVVGLASTPTPPGSMLKVSGHSVGQQKNPTLNLGVRGLGHRNFEAADKEEHASRIRIGVAMFFPPTVDKFREKCDKAYYKVSLDSISHSTKVASWFSV